MAEEAKVGDGAVHRFDGLDRVFRRNWLGVHTLWDVLAAMGLSLAVLCGCRFLFEWIEKKPNRDWKVWLTASVVTVLSRRFIQPAKITRWIIRRTGVCWSIRLSCRPTASAVPGWRWAFGWDGWWNGAGIRFQTEGGALRRCLRFIIGALLTLALYAGVLPAILAPLGEHWGKFFKYFVTFVFAVAGYPALFRAVGRRIGQKKW